MTETTQVNVKLPVSMKREWEEYIEDSNETNSLSHLIRLSVQREINGKNQTAAPEVELDADDVEFDIELGSIERRLDTLEDTILEVRDTVSALETGQLADEDQIEDIANRVYDTLPRRTRKRKDDVPELTTRELADELVGDAHRYMEERNSSIEDLADRQNFEFGLIPVYQEYFGVNDYVMQQVVERVEQMSSRVHVFTDFQYSVIFEEE